MNTRVRLQRLRTQELNGLIGHVVNYDDSKARYNIRHENEEYVKPVAVKHGNLLQLVEGVQVLCDDNSEDCTASILTGSLYESRVSEFDGVIMHKYLAI